MRYFPATFLVLAASAGLSQAAVIASWSFEPPFTDLSNSTTSPSVSAAVGTGAATGVHTATATDWTTPVGNGSTDSFSANEWAVGDYWQFSVSASGFEDIIVMWDQTRSSTGPATFDMEYSVNGGAFTTALDNYAVLVNAVSAAPVTAAWTSGTNQPVFTFTVDLSAVPAVDNAATLVVRLRSDAAAGGTGGTNRVDNVIISGTAIPEPGVSLLGLAAMGLFLRRSR